MKKEKTFIEQRLDDLNITEEQKNKIIAISGQRIMVNFDGIKTKELKKKNYTKQELIEKKKRFIEKHGKDGQFFLGETNL